MKSPLTFAFISICILLNSPISNAQERSEVSEFYYQYHQGNLLRDQGKLDSACIVYEKSFETIDFVNSFVLTKVLKVAKKAEYTPLITECEKRLKLQAECPNENLALLEEVLALNKLDQDVRSNKYGRASQYYHKHKDNNTKNNSTKFYKAKKLRDHWVSVDSSNIQAVLDIIGTHGYLGEQELGYLNKDRFWIMLFHFDRDTNNVVLAPILDQALLKNKLSPHRYAITLDRHSYNTTHSQTYWSWPMLDSDPKLSPEEINTILKLKENIGIWGTKLEVKNKGKHWWLVY